MTGHAFALVEEFHHLRTQPHVELLLDQRIGHGVVVAVDFHMVINIDPGKFPLGIFIGLDGRGRRAGRSSVSNSCWREPGSFLKGRAFRVSRRGARAALTSSEREEGVVPEPGQYPALHDLDPDLHLGLIAWLGSAGGDDGKAIMLGEGRIGAIDLGFIAVGTGHGRFEVIGDDDLGDPTEGRKGPDMGADPVGQTLGPGRLGIGVVRGPRTATKIATSCTSPLWPLTTGMPCPA